MVQAASPLRAPAASLLSTSGMRALRSRLGIGELCQPPVDSTEADTQPLSNSQRRHRLESMLRASLPPPMSPPADEPLSPNCNLDVEERVATLRDKLRRRQRSEGSAKSCSPSPPSSVAVHVDEPNIDQLVREELARRRIRGASAEPHQSHASETPSEIVMSQSLYARQSLPPPRKPQSTTNGGISPLAAAVARKQRLQRNAESKGDPGARAGQLQGASSSRALHTGDLVDSSHVQPEEDTGPAGGWGYSVEAVMLCSRAMTPPAPKHAARRPSNNPTAKGMPVKGLEQAPLAAAEPTTAAALLMDSLDTNNDGVISRSEFVAGMATAPELQRFPAAGPELTAETETAADVSPLTRSVLDAPTPAAQLPSKRSPEIMRNKATPGVELAAELGAVGCQSLLVSPEQLQSVSPEEHETSSKLAWSVQDLIDATERPVAEQLEGSAHLQREVVAEDSELQRIQALQLMLQEARIKAEVDAEDYQRPLPSAAELEADGCVLDEADGTNCSRVSEGTVSPGLSATSAAQGEEYMNCAFSEEAIHETGAYPGECTNCVFLKDELLIVQGEAMRKLESALVAVREQQYEADMLLQQQKIESARLLDAQRVEYDQKIRQNLERCGTQVAAAQQHVAVVEAEHASQILQMQQSHQAELLKEQSRHTVLSGQVEQRQQLEQQQQQIAQSDAALRDANIKVGNAQAASLEHSAQAAECQLQLKAHQHQLLELQDQAIEMDRELQRRSLIASRLSSKLHHTQQQHVQQVAILEEKLLAMILSVEQPEDTSVHVASSMVRSSVVA